MKTTYFYLITTIVLHVFCQSVQADNYQQYFPLQNNNDWHYRIEKTETIYGLPDSIFGEITLHGESYHKWGDNREFPIFIRQDNQGRIFRRINNAEKLWFDFTRQNGEQYVWSPDGFEEFIVTVKKNISVMTYAGQFDNCIEFNFDNPKAIDEEYSYVFAPGVGIVKKQYSRLTMLLASAQVDRKYIARARQTKTNMVSGFSLYQNYPNPFNATTFIRFALPKEVFVSLEIFDIRGTRVRTLVAAAQAPGEYITMWDGTDDSGIAVNSGIYTYRLTTDEFVEIKRMVMLR